MRRLLCVLLVVLIQGCTTLQPERDSQWQWQLNGRAVFQGPDQRESVSMLWQSANTRDLIQLSGPLGQGTVRLIADQNGAALWKNGEIVASDQSIEALLYQQLQWHVPISSLKHWVRGNVAPSREPLPLIIEEGSSSQFIQHGWRISTCKWNDQGLPGKVVLERSPYKLTLLISTWKS